jgi:hypothetical protein
MRIVECADEFVNLFLVSHNGSCVCSSEQSHEEEQDEDDVTNNLFHVIV